MREIKFRAWCKHDGRMVEVDAMALAANVFEWGPGITDQHNDFHAMGDIALMQFTGLLDKNGKEIYEGDIIKMDDKEYGSPDSARVVEFTDGSFIESVAWPASEIQNWCEVIGNIYENPDLLEAK